MPTHTTTRRQSRKSRSINLRPRVVAPTAEQLARAAALPRLSVPPSASALLGTKA